MEFLIVLVLLVALGVVWGRPASDDSGLGRRRPSHGYLATMVLAIMASAQLVIEQALRVDETAFGSVLAIFLVVVLVDLVAWPRGTLVGLSLVGIMAAAVNLAQDVGLITTALTLLLASFVVWISGLMRFARL